MNKDKLSHLLIIFIIIDRVYAIIQQIFPLFYIKIYPFLQNALYLMLSDFVLGLLEPVHMETFYKLNGSKLL